MALTARFTRVFVTAALLAAGGPCWPSQAPPERTHLDAQLIALACRPPCRSPRLLRRCSSRAARMHPRGTCTALATSSPSTAGPITASRSARNITCAACSRRAERACREPHPAIIRTAGWIRIYAVDPTMSLATISHACDTIDIDDYLEPFTCRGHRAGRKSAEAAAGQLRSYSARLGPPHAVREERLLHDRSRQRSWRHPGRRDSSSIATSDGGEARQAAG